MAIKEYNISMSGFAYWIRLSSKIDLQDSTHIYIENSDKVSYAFTPLQYSWRRVREMFDDMSIYDITERKNCNWIHTIRIIKRR